MSDTARSWMEKYITAWTTNGPDDIRALFTEDAVYATRPHDRDPWTGREQIVDRWLARHQNVHFHYTPTRASWLNQVECWFSILAGQSLQGASFTSVPELRRHIDAFIAAYNETARPFAWSKSDVHQKRLKPRFTDL